MKLTAIPQHIQGYIQYPLRASPDVFSKPKQRAPSISHNRPIIEALDKDEGVLNKSLDNKGLKILLSKH